MADHTHPGPQFSSVYEERKVPSVSKRELILCAGEDLHARPAARFAQAAVDLDTILVKRPGGPPVDGKSVLQLMSLGIRAGETVVISGEGANIEHAFESLTAIVVTRHAQTR